MYQWSSSLPNADWFTFLVADFFKWRPSEPFDLIFDYTYVSIYLAYLLFWRQFRSPLLIHTGSFVPLIRAWGWLGQRQLVAFWNQMESLSPWYIWWGQNLYASCLLLHWRCYLLIIWCYDRLNWTLKMWSVWFTFKIYMLFYVIRIA